MSEIENILYTFITNINKIFHDFDVNKIYDLQHSEVVKDLIEDIHLYFHLREKQYIVWTSNKGIKLLLDNFLKSSIQTLKIIYDQIQFTLSNQNESI